MCFLGFHRIGCRLCFIDMGFSLLCKCARQGGCSSYERLMPLIATRSRRAVGSYLVGLLQSCICICDTSTYSQWIRWIWLLLSPMLWALLGALNSHYYEYSIYNAKMKSQLHVLNCPLQSIFCWLFTNNQNQQKIDCQVRIEHILNKVRGQIGAFSKFSKCQLKMLFGLSFSLPTNLAMSTDKLKPN